MSISAQCPFEHSWSPVHQSRDTPRLPYVVSHCTPCRTARDSRGRSRCAWAGLVPCRGCAATVPGAACWRREVPGMTGATHTRVSSTCSSTLPRITHCTVDSVVYDEQKSTSPPPHQGARHARAFSARFTALHTVTVNCVCWGVQEPTPPPQ